ncbi:MAG TPA: ATP synthase F0 subunit B [Candidatus Acidoferrales bacterium]|nr:ATP synthase F0 subunit B [Candidatus Acidoferrales bacterium]
MNPNFYVQAASWSQIIASVLFIGVLAWIWSKYIQPAILAAQERANKIIAEAERHRDEAKATLDLLQSEAEGARRDAELIKQRAVEQGRREHAATIAEAREAGERALKGAAGEFDRAIAAAKRQLRFEMLEKALDRARDEATRRIDASADARLVENFVTSMERSAPDRFEVTP